MEKGEGLWRKRVRGCGGRGEGVMKKEGKGVMGEGVMEKEGKGLRGKGEGLW